MHTGPRCPFSAPPNMFSSSLSSFSLSLRLFIYCVYGHICTHRQLYDTHVDQKTTCGGYSFHLVGSLCHLQIIGLGGKDIYPLGISLALLYHSFSSSPGQVQIIMPPQKPYVKDTSKLKTPQPQPLVGEELIVTGEHCLGLYINEKLICTALSHCTFKRPEASATLRLHTMQISNVLG